MSPGAAESADTCSLNPTGRSAPCAFTRRRLPSQPANTLLRAISPVDEIAAVADAVIVRRDDAPTGSNTAH
jgi:hypothetical protein